MVSDITNPTPSQKAFAKSTKLADVLYDIRGPILREAKALENAGHHILKLNIGNPAPFGLNAPPELVQDIIRNLPQSEGYADSQGVYAARRAVMQEAQRIGIPGVDIEHIYLGNGVSELIVMSMQGLLNSNDEVLVPSPDYPLWSAAIRLAGGIPVHYRCDEDADWEPDLEDIQRKTTSHTVGLVVINPNNPTGAVYSRSVIEDLIDWAARSNLLVLADEIYSKITYDDAEYIPCASIREDVLVLTFDGLSKTYRAAGFRAGWMIISGPIEQATDYIEGLGVLAAMRLCANVPSQHAIQGALGGHQSIYEHTSPGGRLYEQRRIAYDALTQIPGISCIKPKGALYFFPKMDVDRFHVRDDERFVLDFLREEKILLVQGSGFNYPEQDHFRIVFLPTAEELLHAIERLGVFLASYAQ